MHFDVFNGDADGIIALVQLRLARPKESRLITGVKRDIALLKQVSPEQANSVTVLDISMEQNSDALASLLAHQVEVFYVDHHRPGDIPEDEHLKATINTDANTCTSLLVNELLQGQYVNWAIAAAFGDNMKAAATALAEKAGLSKEQRQQLEALGIYINYNGYGRDLDDLHFHPAELFKLLVKYKDPLELIADSNSIFATLESAYRQDMAKAKSARVLFDGPSAKVVLLADQPWARRVSGVFGNDLANASPDKAHAVLTLNADLSYTVSVRAPLNNKQGADSICVQFPTGGGRAAAAGINHLPQEKLEAFIEAVSQYYLT
ncbi:DHH family phosphoesterase [Thalassomonas viridans]|uniref:DHH family phosphoesterase n=1 Tax=Thalassomonas viridans TaxID=137584 RepID=A0AAF0C876_9GAMM|nr:acetyltransferase [Thalassomonas viridans]WDE03915.1 DHH family phosphoesterase [Thalassomonas viridans]